MSYAFKLPDIGEGLAEGEIVKWLVGEGEEVRENQPLVNVLTDKAEVEIPSPKTGRVGKIHARPGEKVPVGSVLVEILVAGETPLPAGAPERAAAPAYAPQSAKAPAPAGVLATPAVRKLAQELKVDLSGLQGGGPGGRLTEDDVRKAAKVAGPAPARESQGPEERVPFLGIRRRTAEKMAESARSIPHVTHADEADVTALLGLRRELQDEAQKRGVKLTPLAFVLKALAAGLKAHPALNASLDEAAESIVLKKYYHLGVAVSSGGNLWVPVIRDADKKDLWSLAEAIAELAAKVRENRLGLQDMQGGTFTVTNIGPIGGLHATPLIHSPEAAILGVMKIQERPAVREGLIVARSMLNLCLSFDHRLLDGAEAAAFVNCLIRHLENPRTLL